MPDDKKDTEQEIEESPEDQVDETELAFAEEIEEEKEPDEKEKAAEDKKPDETPKKRGRPKKEVAEKSDEEGKKIVKKEPEKKEKEDEEEEEEEEEPEKLSAKEKLDKHLESIKDEEEEPPAVEKEKEPEKKEVKKETEEVKPSKMTKELLAERLKLISGDDLPGEIIIGDETINLKQYAEDYAEDYAAIRVLSSLTAEKMIEKALGNLSFAKSEDIDTKIGNLELRVTQLSFDNAVVQAIDEEGNLKHPDYFTITRGSGMKDFHAWVKEQSPKIQKLANSLEPEDGILILDYYKENTAKERTAELDKKTKDKKKEYDDIYRGKKSVKKDRTESGQGQKSDNEEAEESFNEE